jgi:hypothetical protein
MVLVRAACTAGTNVAKTATAKATPMTMEPVDTVTGGDPAAPSSPAPGLVSSGASPHPDRQARDRSDEGHAQMLDEQYCRHCAWGGPDSFEQPNPARLFGQAAPDQDGDAGEGEQNQQPTADEQDKVGTTHQLGGVSGNVLPRLDQNGRAGRRGSGV